MPNVQKGSGPSNELRVALAPFLRSCSGVVTLGIRASMGDYSEEEKILLNRAERIFFPTPRFIDVFRALEKPTFPAATTYAYQHSRILQQLLLQYLNWPHPRTRIYFGMKQKRQILRDFCLPVLGMGPRAVPGTVHLMDRTESLDDCVSRYNPLIAQEKVCWTDRIRLLCVLFECIGAQRLSSVEPSDEHYEPLPLSYDGLKEILAKTRQLLRLAHLDDIIVEWGYGNGRWQLIGMARPPAQWNTPDGVLDRHWYICGLIRSGLL